MEGSPSTRHPRSYMGAVWSYGSQAVSAARQLGYAMGACEDPKFGILRSHVMLDGDIQLNNILREETYRTVISERGHELLLCAWEGRNLVNFGLLLASPLVREALEKPLPQEKSPYQLTLVFHCLQVFFEASTPTDVISQMFLQLLSCVDLYACNQNAQQKKGMMPLLQGISSLGVTATKQHLIDGVVSLEHFSPYTRCANGVTALDIAIQNKDEMFLKAMANRKVNVVRIVDDQEVTQQVTEIEKALIEGDNWLRGTLTRDELVDRSALMILELMLPYFSSELKVEMLDLAFEKGASMTILALLRVMPDGFNKIPYLFKSLALDEARVYETLLEEFSDLTELRDHQGDGLYQAALRHYHQKRSDIAKRQALLDKMHQMLEKCPDLLNQPNSTTGIYSLEYCIENLPYKDFTPLSHSSHWDFSVSFSRAQGEISCFDFACKRKQVEYFTWMITCCAEEEINAGLSSESIAMLTKPAYHEFMEMIKTLSTGGKDLTAVVERVLRELRGHIRGSDPVAIVKSYYAQFLICKLFKFRFDKLLDGEFLDSIPAWFQESDLSNSEVGSKSVMDTDLELVRDKLDAAKQMAKKAIDKACKEIKIYFNSEESFGAWSREFDSASFERSFQKLSLKLDEIELERKKENGAFSFENLNWVCSLKEKEGVYKAAQRRLNEIIRQLCSLAVSYEDDKVAKEAALALMKLRAFFRLSLDYTCESKFGPLALYLIHLKGNRDLEKKVHEFLHKNSVVAGSQDIFQRTAYEIARERNIESLSLRLSEHSLTCLPETCRLDFASVRSLNGKKWGVNHVSMPENFFRHDSARSPCLKDTVAYLRNRLTALNIRHDIPDSAHADIDARIERIEQVYVYLFENVPDSRLALTHAYRKLRAPVDKQYEKLKSLENLLERNAEDPQISVLRDELQSIPLIDCVEKVVTCANSCLHVVLAFQKFWERSVVNCYKNEGHAMHAALPSVYNSISRTLYERFLGEQFPLEHPSRSVRVALHHLSLEDAAKAFIWLSEHGHALHIVGSEFFIRLGELWSSLQTSPGLRISEERSMVNALLMTEKLRRVTLEYGDSTTRVREEIQRHEEIAALLTEYTRYFGVISDELIDKWQKGDPISTAEHGEALAWMLNRLRDFKVLESVLSIYEGVSTQEVETEVKDEVVRRFRDAVDSRESMELDQTRLLDKFTEFTEAYALLITKLGFDLGEEERGAWFELLKGYKAYISPDVFKIVEKSIATRFSIDRDQKQIERLQAEINELSIEIAEMMTGVAAPSHAQSEEIIPDSVDSSGRPRLKDLQAKKSLKKEKEVRLKELAEQVSWEKKLTDIFNSLRTWYRENVEGGALAKVNQVVSRSASELQQITYADVHGVLSEEEVMIIQPASPDSALSPHTFTVFEIEPGRHQLVQNKMMKKVGSLLSRERYLPPYIVLEYLQAKELLAIQAKKK